MQPTQLFETAPVLRAMAGVSADFHPASATAPTAARAVACFAIRNWPPMHRFTLATVAIVI